MTKFVLPRLIISGLSGGGGKTFLSLGLSSALVKRGIRVKTYKKGPDYIDAAWLALASKQACTNLDPFFLEREELCSLFAASSKSSQIAIIEGNRGLYDGRDLQGSCSTATLARMLKAPIVLALNCTKMTRTAAAVVAGLAAFEPVNLAGVVLNMVGTKRHGELVHKAIEYYTGIKVLGLVPRMAINPLPERHMGLNMPEQTNPVLSQLGDMIEQYTDVPALCQVAENAVELEARACFWSGCPVPAKVRIGVVQDTVLWFYYEENLEALRRAGAEIVNLSLLDQHEWPEVDGLYLGGGFPELLAAKLSASPHLLRIRLLSEQNMPIYAECGGFMILAQALLHKDQEYPMAGIFPAKTIFSKKPQGLGYIEAKVISSNPFHPVGTVLKGHEFHYSRCEPVQPLHCCLQLNSGSGMGQGQDGLLVRNTFAAYTHIFAPATPHWADNFVLACAEFKKEKMCI